MGISATSTIYKILLQHLSLVFCFAAVASGINKLTLASLVQLILYAQ